LTSDEQVVEEGAWGEYGNRAFELEQVRVSGPVTSVARAVAAAAIR
jgi:hypothetical protein